MASKVQTAIGERNAESLKQAGMIGQTDDAKGFLWAQRVMERVRTHQGEFTRLAHELWDMSTAARDFAHKSLTEFIKQAKLNAGNSGEKIAGYDAKKWGRIARTATVRASQMQAIIRAMNGNDTLGMLTQDQFAKKLGLAKDDVTNVAIEVLYQFARDWNGAKAAAGRKPDTIEQKLAKFLKREKEREDAAPADVRFCTKVIKVLEMNHIHLPDVAKAQKEEKVDHSQGVAKAHEQATAAAERVVKRVRKAKPAAPVQAAEDVNPSVADQPLHH